MNYTKPLGREAVTQILSNSVDRIYFLRDYKFFGRDNNSDQYTRYVLTIIKSERNLDIVSDALLLAIKVGRFSESLLTQVRVILRSRRHYLVKLGCLDFLFAFKNRISRTSFYQLNEEIRKKSKNNLLVIQATLNLMSLNVDLVDDLFTTLKKSQSPTEFYRVVNGFGQIGFRLSQERITKFTEILESKSFAAKVNEELRQRFFVMQ